jgi:hypothetical protein
MRTVTFSSDHVSASINSKFVSTWNNRKPGFHNCDQTEEIGISKLSCFPTKNFCTFFVTPRREVLHYFSGYFSPELFMRELDFVLALAKEVVDEKGAIKREAWVRYQEMHRTAAAQRATGALKKSTTDRAKTDDTVAAYLSRVHEQLAKKKTRLDDVFSDYLFGTSWSEEQ